MMDKPHVLLTRPHMGMFHVSNAQAIDQIRRDSSVRLTEHPCTSVPYENNLNTAIRDVFLKGDFDYWLNIDADNAPRRNPLDLINLDLDIVACPYPSIKMDKFPAESPFFWSAYDWSPEGYRPHVFQPEHGELQPVDAVSSGCMLVARRVLLAVKQPLLRLFDDDGVVTRGCDLSFCSKAREAGFRIWSHYGYLCGHQKTVDLLDMLQIIAEAGDG